jgi:hypothetical protein
VAPEGRHLKPTSGPARGPVHSGAAEAPPPALPIVGMISAFEALFEDAAEVLSAELGPVAAACEVFPFDFTKYYNPEMGERLKRTYVVFGNPVEEEALPRVKSLASSVEREFLYPETDRRRINLDPGVLTADHLVLASHKRAAHRICLGEGVYGEIELIFAGGTYEPLPWTYPDYRTPAARSFLERIRSEVLGRSEPR